MFTAEAIADPLAWEVLVAARDDSKLVAKTIDLGPYDVRILGWPDDQEWVDFTAGQVEDGVPVLERLIGLDWPATSTLEVVETASPYLYGYAGWYRPDDSLIEVGDKLDQQVVFHELAHLWFNDDLFSGRWINEAFADQVAAMTIDELGDEAPTPEPVRDDDPGRLALNDWSDPDLQAGVSFDQERYGYNASWSVLHQIVEEIGAERLTEVIEAADAGRPAYLGPGVPEELARTFDWRELLDLLEEVGGSETAADLFEDLVVSDDEAEAFADRLAARARYAELVEAGDGWAPPTGVRLAMTGWRFKTADVLIDQATAVLGDQGGGGGRRRRPRGGRSSGPPGRLRVVQGRAGPAGGGRRGAGRRPAARGGRGRSRTTAPVRSGRWGCCSPAWTGTSTTRGSAFDDGDYDGVLAASAAVGSTMDGAVAAGGLRLAALVLLVVTLLVLRAWRRRRPRRRGGPDRLAPGTTDWTVA